MGRITMMNYFVVLATLLVHSITTDSSYVIPTPLIELVDPRGLRVSIPDSPGISVFAFHGNVNKELSYELEAGEMSHDVLRETNGRWTYHNKNVSLKKGDVIYYWLYVIKDGLGYQSLNQEYTVGDESSLTFVVQ